MITNDELIVNMIQIQQKLEDQVTETSPKKEIIPQAIEKIKKDQKKFKEKIIQEIIKEKESDQEIKPIEEIEKPKQISIDSDFIQSKISDLISDKVIQQRTRVISSQTKERDYQSYFQSWKNKVEKIGALNYPKAARSGINETLVMTVTLNQSGEVINIQMNKSSGVKDLDDAAENIVRLGSPYAPFPESFKEKLDTLQIRRVWRFSNSLGDTSDR
jgi:TonB family protein